MSTRKQRKKLAAAQRSLRSNKRRQSPGQILDSALDAGAAMGEFCTTGPQGYPVVVCYSPASMFDEFPSAESPIASTNSAGRPSDGGVH